MLALTTTSLGAIVAPPLALPKVAHIVTPLHIAACNDDASAARELLTADSIAAVDNNGLTALHVAASAGADDVSELLLEAGTNPNKIDGFGWTPLRWATLHGHAGIVDALVHAGATDEPLDGLSAFELASAAGHVGVAATLIGHGGHRERAARLPMSWRQRWATRTSLSRSQLSRPPKATTSITKFTTIAASRQRARRRCRGARARS